MRLFAVVETCGQQPYTELRYVFMFIGYFSRLAPGWEFFALDRSFDVAQ